LALAGNDSTNKENIVDQSKSEINSNA